MKKIWISICAVICCLIIPIRANAAQTENVSNWDQFLAALSTPGVTNIELEQSISYPRGNDEPLVLPAGITINGNNHTIDTATAGVILNGEATIKNVTFSQYTLPRNVFVLNGHKLTLENVDTTQAIANIDVFCGMITDTTTGSYTTGNHGQLILKGNTKVNNIYAGNFSDSKGSNNSTNTNPVTVTIESDNKVAENFIACGGAEPAQGGDGNKIDASVINYPSTGEIQLNIITSTSNVIGTINGQASLDNAASINYTNTGDYSRGLGFQNIKNIKVSSGALKITNGSTFFSQNTEMGIEGPGILDISSLGNLQISNFSGGGTLVIGKKQTLTITGTTSGSTNVAINYANMPDPAEEGVMYIIAEQAEEANFTFLPSGASLRVPTFADGIWALREEDPDTGEEEVTNPPKLTKFELADQSYINGESSLTLPVTAEFEDDNNNNMSIIPFDVKINNTLCTKEKDIMGEYVFTYTEGNTILKFAAVYGEFYFYTDDDSPFPEDIKYTISVTAPANYTKEGNPMETSCAVTIGNPQVTPDPPTQEEKKIEVPSAIEGLVYNKTQHTGVPQGEGYTLTNHTGTDAGEYTAIASLKDGFAWADGTKEEKEISWEIKPAKLSIKEISIKEKTYDGNKTAIIENIVLENAQKEIYDGSINVNGEFADEQSGMNKEVKITLSINDRNYELNDTTYKTTGNIKKIKTANTTAQQPLYLSNNTRMTYTYELQPLLTSINGPNNLGAVNYSVYSISLGSFYDQNLNPYTITGSTLTLPIQKTAGTVGGSAGDILVKISGNNFETFTVTIPTEITGKKLPTGSPTLSKTTLEYGEKLNGITLSGSLQYQGVKVEGQFQWKEGNVRQEKAGNIAAIWEFLPSDTNAYHSVTGSVNITVKKGIPKGEPSYDAAIPGRPLKEANLTKGTISVPGSIFWDDGESTMIENGKAYGWTFVPQDTTNYENLKGTITFNHKPGNTDTEKTKVSLPVPKTNLIYNKKEQTGVDAAEGYILTNNKGTNAGSYTATATLKEGYIWQDGSESEKLITWEIKPVSLTITEASVQDKDYDGNKTARIILVNLEDENQLPYLGNVIAQGEFETETAGSNKKVIVTVSLDDPNYQLTSTTFEAKGNIRKLKTGDITSTQLLMITKNATKSYHYDLAPLLKSINGPANLGNINYKIESVALGKFYDHNKGQIKVENHTLIIPIQAAEGSTGDSAGTILLSISGDNFETFQATIHSRITDKLVPSGELTLSKSSIEYKEKLNTIAITGKMSYDGKEVEGSFSWKEGEKSQEKAGTIMATWIFTPKDSNTYHVVTGSIIINVKKGIPSGEPGYTKITTAGKYLKDAKLTLGSISVPGTISWQISENTIVEQGKSYPWTFIPSDYTNYEKRSGSLIPYPKETPSEPGNAANNSSGNANTSGSQSSSSTTSKNYPGIVQNNTTKVTTTPENKKEVPTSQTKKTGQSSASSNRGNNQKQEDLETFDTKSLSDLKVEIEKGFKKEDISSSLYDAGFTTEKRISDTLYKALKEENENLKKSDTQLYEISMLYTPDKGDTWIEAEEEHYPEGGMIKVRIKAPKGTHPQTHEYYAAHMFSENAFGKIAGEIEIPLVMETTNEKGEYCIEFYITGLSPVMIGWVEKEEIVENLFDDNIDLDKVEVDFDADQTPTQKKAKETIAPTLYLLGGFCIFLIIIAGIAGFIITKRMSDR